MCANHKIYNSIEYTFFNSRLKSIFNGKPLRPIFKLGDKFINIILVNSVVTIVIPLLIAEVSNINNQTTEVCLL